MKSSRHLFAIACFALLAAGCPRSPTDDGPPGSARLPLEGRTLRLAVVGDPALAEAVMHLRGEWNAQTGAELEVVELSEDQLREADAPPADALIIPSYMLGELAERDSIAPVPKAITDSNPWSGIFDLPKLREAAWGKRTMAVPFGSPVFCCYYRADLLEKHGRQPPQTWREYLDLAKLLAAERPDDPQWCASLEPLAPGWAGLTLLARAAPAAKHHGNYSTLFNIDTMEPLIAGPPFVEALEELAAAAKLSRGDPPRLDPAGVRKAFWNGRCGLAVTWPTGAAEGKEARGKGRGERGEEKKLREEGRETEGTDDSATAESPGEPIRVGFAELPGSPRVYNVSEKAWGKRAEDADHRVSLLAVAGRLGVVSNQTENQPAAFKLLLWLSDDRMSVQTSALSPAATMFRHAHRDAPGLWVEETVPHAAAVEYGAAAAAAFAHEQWLAALRIPGRAEYLAALDEAVAAALDGRSPPKDALEQAAQKWREITNRLDADKQKSAYRHCVGL